jgi:hypothetical protein
LSWRRDGGRRLESSTQRRRNSAKTSRKRLATNAFAFAKRRQNFRSRSFFIKGIKEMNRIVITIFVFITVTVLAIALVFYLQKDIRSNFGCYPDDIGAIRPRTTCILNPLRDKTPEQIAN